MVIETKIIEEFSDEKKFAKRIQDHLNTSPEKKHDVHYVVSQSDKGFLYSALIITEE